VVGFCFGGRGGPPATESVRTAVPVSWPLCAPQHEPPRIAACCGPFSSHPSGLPYSLPTAGAAPTFAAHVSQSNPQPCDQTFVNVQASWSGNFMNYSGQNAQWQFHLLATAGNPVIGGGDANVEVYAIGAGMSSGPVNVGSTLLCTTYTF